MVKELASIRADTKDHLTTLNNKINDLKKIVGNGNQDPNEQKGPPSMEDAEAPDARFEVLAFDIEKLRNEVRDNEVWKIDNGISSTNTKLK